MEKQDMTILEASRALGYTKNAVKYQAAKLGDGEIYKDETGVLRITAAGLDALAAKMGKKGANQQTTAQEPDNNRETTDQQPTNNRQNAEQQPAKNQQTTTKEPANNHQKTTSEQAENRGDSQLYEALLRTVETLEAQLRIKDVQIESLTRLLDQQQHLQAAQIQALKAPASDEHPEETHQKEPVKDETPSSTPTPRRGIFGLFRKKDDS